MRSGCLSLQGIPRSCGILCLPDDQGTSARDPQKPRNSGGMQKFPLRDTVCLVSQGGRFPGMPAALPFLRLWGSRPPDPCHPVHQTPVPVIPQTRESGRTPLLHHPFSPIWPPWNPSSCQVGQIAWVRCGEGDWAGLSGYKFWSSCIHSKRPAYSVQLGIHVQEDPGVQAKQWSVDLLTQTARL